MTLPAVAVSNDPAVSTARKVQGGAAQGGQRTKRKSQTEFLVFPKSLGYKSNPRATHPYCHHLADPQIMTAPPGKWRKHSKQ